MVFDGSIAEIVPHDPPMLLLDRYVSSDETGLVAEVGISEASPFYQSDLGVPSYVGIEYIAQAISAFNGLSDYLNGNKIEPGFLLGSRKVGLKIPYFPKDSILTVSVKIIFNDGEMVVFSGQVLLDGDVVVEGKLNAYQPEDPLGLIEKAQVRNK